MRTDDPIAAVPATSVHIVPKNATSQAIRLPALTGLRFLAAMLVVFFHFGAVAIDAVPVPPGIGYLLRQSAHNIAASGFVGVSFFFVLSGFILSYTYIDANGQVRGGQSAFWKARFARIYPLYFVAFVIAAFPFIWYHDRYSAAAPVMTGLVTLVLIQAWFPRMAFAWNAPGWSLSVEAFFYLLFPLVAIPIARLSRRQLWRMLMACWLVGLIMPLVYILVNPDGLHYPWNVVDTFWLRAVTLMPLLRLPEFLLGLALGRLFVINRSDTSALTPRLPAALAPIALVVALSLGPFLPYPLMENGLLDPLFALLIFTIASGKSLLSRILSTPSLVLLGESSYALYLLHHPLWYWMDHMLSAPIAGDPRSIPYFLTYLGLALGAAIMTFYCVERPARSAIRRIIATRRHLVYAQR